MAEKSLLLQILDHLWKEHLLHLDHLRQGIHLRGYAQRDPLNEYKREAFDLFEAMLTNLRQTVTQVLSHLEVRMQQPEPDRHRADAPPVAAARHRSRRAGDGHGRRRRCWRSIRPIRRPGARCRATRPAPAARAGSSSSATGGSPDRPSSRAEHRMNPLAILLLLAMLATAGVLFVGLVGFFSGGEFNERYGNRLMRARVGLQLLAVTLLGLLFLTQH